MSHRLQVTVADDVADELERRGRIGGQPASRVAAQLIDRALTAGPRSEPRATAAYERAPGRHVAQREPPWLEPHDPDDRRRWRADIWTLILAMLARYPEMFSNLENRWWRKTTRTEQLAAMAVWRRQIDENCGDPREELSFQAQLADFNHLLEHTPGVGADVFRPGAPPAEWLEPRTNPGIHQSIGAQSNIR